MLRGRKTTKYPKNVPGILRGTDCVSGIASATPGPGQEEQFGRVVLHSEGPARESSCSKAAEKQVRVWTVSEGFSVKKSCEVVRCGSLGLDGGCIEDGRGASSSAEKQEQVIEMLRTAKGKEAAAKALVDGMLTPGSRATKAGKLRTLLKFAEIARFELFPLTAEKLNPILGAMKMAGYRSADSYLHEARQRHVQLRHPVSDELKLYFKDAVRAVVRGRGPTRRAPVVMLEDLVEAGTPLKWAEQDDVASGPAAPWDVFVVACWWMLRGAEVLALRTGSADEVRGKVGEHEDGHRGRGQTTLLPLHLPSGWQWRSVVPSVCSRQVAA